MAIISQFEVNLTRRQQGTKLFTFALRSHPHSRVNLVRIYFYSYYIIIAPRRKTRYSVRGNQIQVQQSRLFKIIPRQASQDENPCGVTIAQPSNSRGCQRIRKPRSQVSVLQFNRPQKQLFIHQRCNQSQGPWRRLLQPGVVTNVGFSSREEITPGCFSIMATGRNSISRGTPRCCVTPFCATSIRRRINKNKYKRLN